MRLVAIFMGLFILSGPLHANPPAKEPVKTAGPTLAASREVIYFCQMFRNRSVLCRMDPDGQNRAWLHHDRGAFLAAPPQNEKGDDWCPAASADGRLLACFSNRDGAANVWLMGSDGGDQQKLTDSDINLARITTLHRGQIAFSPDSKRLAWVANEQPWVYDLATRQVASLNEAREVQSLAWSKDSKSLAYVSRHSVFLARLTSPVVVTLVADEATGPNVAFGQDLILFDRQGAWTVTLKDKTFNRVLHSNAKRNTPSLSPDGGTLCMLADSPDHQQEVFTTPLSGAKATQVTQGGAESCLWSQDGKRIYFQRQGQLWSITLAGEAHLNSRPLTQARVAFPISAMVALPQEAR